MKKLLVLFAGHARLWVIPAALVLVFASGPGRSVAADWYVATNGIGAGTSWADAINSIQGAINAASAGETVWVSNGVYEAGGVTNYPKGTVLTNRVAIWKAITVRSANNDPANTLIKGATDNGTNGPASVRCVYMTNGSVLIGFTLTNGATLHANYPAWVTTNDNHYGGGVWCQSTTPVISNCMIVGNMAASSGGGAYYGTLYNCTLITNSIFAWGSTPMCYGAGACFSTLYNCTLTKNWGKLGSLYGGAVYAGTAYNCTLISNSATYGGGVYNGSSYNCLIIGNSGASGGGVRLNYGGALYSCTITRNTATSAGGGVYNTGGGTPMVANCIIWGNTYATSSNIYITGTSTTLSNNCSGPVWDGAGSGNIGADPQFADTSTDNYRLKNTSPCINTGTNGSWTTSYPYDLDWRARVRYGTVDMGAYERIHNGTICGVH